MACNQRQSIRAVNQCYNRFDHLLESMLQCETSDYSMIDVIIADESSLEIQLHNYFGAEYIEDYNIVSEGVITDEKTSRI